MVIRKTCPNHMRPYKILKNAIVVNEEGNRRVLGLPNISIREYVNRISIKSIQNLNIYQNYRFRKASLLY